MPGFFQHPSTNNNHRHKPSPSPTPSSSPLLIPEILTMILLYPEVNRYEFLTKAIRVSKFWKEVIEDEPFDATLFRLRSRAVGKKKIRFVAGKIVGESIETKKIGEYKLHPLFESLTYYPSIGFAYKGNGDRAHLKQSLVWPPIKKIRGGRFYWLAKYQRFKVLLKNQKGVTVGDFMRYCRLQMSRKKIDGSWIYCTSDDDSVWFNQGWQLEVRKKTVEGKGKELIINLNAWTRSKFDYAAAKEDIGLGQIDHPYYKWIVDESEMESGSSGSEDESELTELSDQ